MNYRVSNMALICAMIVVSIHVGITGPVHSYAWCMKELVAEGVARIAVPFFFVSSGYFLGRRYMEGSTNIISTWKTTCWKRVRTICIPYWFWNLLYAPIIIGLALISDITSGRTLRTIPWMSIVTGIVGLSDPPLFPLWFLRSLMVFVVLAPLLWSLVRCLRWIAPAVIYIVFISQWGFGWMSISLVPMDGLAYFVLGMAVANGFSYAIRRATAWGLLTVSLVVGFSIRWYRPEIDILPFWIPFVLFGVWGVVPDRPWHQFATASFPVYCLHMFVLLALQYAWHLTAFMPNGILFIFRWCVAVLLSIAIAMIVKRFLPRMAQIAWGGR